MVKITRLEPWGSLVHFTSDCMTIKLDRDETKELLGVDENVEFPSSITAPEIVHFEITSRCNLNCDYCYIDQTTDEIGTEKWLDLIDELIEMRVFQITLGGGEPLLRKSRVFDIAEYIENKPMNIAMTTNGTVPVDDERLGLFDQINISHHGSLEEIDESVRTISRHTDVGINFLLNMSTIDDVPEVSKYCMKNDLELLLMTYKPVNGDWENMINPDTVYSVAEELSDLGVKVAVDKMTERECTGSERFCTIASDGLVYPCSYVRKPVGSITDESFQKIWDKKYKPNCPYLT